MVNKLEWHELRQYAQEFYRTRAGYIPPKMPTDYDWLSEFKVTVKVHKIVQMWYTERLKYNKLIVEFPTVCDGCMYYIRKNLVIRQDIGLCVMCSTLPYFDKCECCGKLGIEAQLPY